MFVGKAKPSAALFLLSSCTTETNPMDTPCMGHRCVWLVGPWRNYTARMWRRLPRSGVPSQLVSTAPRANSLRQVRGQRLGGNATGICTNVGEPTVGRRLAHSKAATQRRAALPGRQAKAWRPAPLLSRFQTTCSHTQDTTVKNRKHEPDLTIPGHEADQTPMQSVLRARARQRQATRSTN